MKQKKYREIKKNWTEPEAELDKILGEERYLTNVWYSRMSGEKSWLPGEKGMFDAKFEQISKRVRELQPRANAEWFAGLSN